MSGIRQRTSDLEEEVVLYSADKGKKNPRKEVLCSLSCNECHLAVRTFKSYLGTSEAGGRGYVCNNGLSTEFAGVIF